MKVFCPHFAILSRRSGHSCRPMMITFFANLLFFIPTVFYTVTANISITEKEKRKPAHKLPEN